MGLNPFIEDTDEDQQWKDSNVIGIEGAIVTQTKTNTASDDTAHAVKVIPDLVSSEIVADVAIGQTGDVCIPTEDSRVVIAYRENERPVVLGQRYTSEDTIPEFEPGERIIGHPLSDSYIKIDTEGKIRINGGETGVVTDVDFTNDTVSRSEILFVP